MNLLESRVVLRERPLLDVLDLALRFIASSSVPYAKLAAVTALPTFLLAWLALWQAGPLVAWIVALTFGLLFEPTFTVLASRLVFEPTTRVRDVVRAALARTFVVSALRLVQSTAIVVSSVALFIPGLWLFAILLFVLEAALLEGATVGKAIERSRRIAGADMGDALLATVLLLGAHVAAVFAFDSAGRTVVENILQTTPPASLLDTGATPLALFAYLAFIPYLATARFLLYLNLRTRSEGWDIQTRFTGIAARAQVAP